MTNYFNAPIHRLAKVRHRCIYCGESIPKSTRYVYQTGVFDGKWYSNHFHRECFNELCDDGESEFTPYSHERPNTENEP